MDHEKTLHPCLKREQPQPQSVVHLAASQSYSEADGASQARGRSAGFLLETRVPWLLKAYASREFGDRFFDSTRLKLSFQRLLKGLVL